MGTSEHWRLVYKAKRPEEVSWFQGSPEASLAALDRIGATPDRALVDVGAGASTLAETLLDRGWSDLTLLDIADPALDTVRERLGRRAGGIRFEVADVRHWRPDRVFDIWHDRAVFHFLTKGIDRAAYLRALAEGTRAGSYVIIATFAPDGPDKCSGLPVRRYDSKALAAEFGDGFQMLDSWPETHVTPWGAQQRFQWVVFRRK